MSQLTDNLNLIVSIKSDIKSAIENKGVDMTGVSFPGYASKIGEISVGGQFITEPLNVTSNGTYTPGQGVDGFSTVTVDVPQSVTGYTVRDVLEVGLDIVNLYDSSITMVRNYAMAENNKLQTVDLPACTSVGTQAFHNCPSLQTVSLPACTSVGTQAFYHCSSLQTVSLPACTKLIDQQFYMCKSLKNISLPACTKLTNFPFGECDSLISISLPVCIYIGWYAFGWCDKLKYVYVGGEISDVCHLDNINAFDSCSALTSIYVPTSLVDSYKTATNWTYYSDKIVGI